MKKIYLFVAVIMSLSCGACRMRAAISNGSMQPTLEIGDIIVYEKYEFGKYTKGDILVICDKKKETYAKRFIASENDQLEFKNGKVILNGKTLHEPYVKGETYLKGNIDLNGLVPKGVIVVLGDNRENSCDSRSFGYLSISNIEGKVIKVNEIFL
ncbi:MAG TPA: signal peptidase I [Spirochaetota bacterium]|nr:signal peptidase I [Spirochaetota bacterium]HOR44175.1 signal peptidase I [Spirochaetota bacterium]HPK55137.1 signal peptidase I [Spirochaetota bacterium]